MQQARYDQARYDAASRQWDAFIQSAGGATGFMQSSWWSQLMLGQGFVCADAFLLDGDRITGGAKVLINPFAADCAYFYIPDGPVLAPDPAVAASQFRELLTRVEALRAEAPPGQRVSHLRIEPKWQSLPPFTADFIEAPDWFEPRSTAYVDLTASAEEILARMPYNGRSRVRKAMQLGVRVVEDVTESAITDFLGIYGSTMHSKGVAPMGAEFLTELLRTLFNNGHGTLFFAEYAGQRIAAAIVVFFGERATYFFAGSLAEHREAMAPYLLNYTIMTRAKARGCRWYDLYGVAPTTDPQHPWAGISAFKRNLGGVDVHFVPALDYVYDEAAYRMYLGLNQSG